MFFGTRRIAYCSEITPPISFSVNVPLTHSHSSHTGPFSSWTFQAFTSHGTFALTILSSYNHMAHFLTRGVCSNHALVMRPPLITLYKIAISPHLALIISLTLLILSFQQFSLFSLSYVFLFIYLLSCSPTPHSKYYINSTRLGKLPLFFKVLSPVPTTVFAKINKLFLNE